MNKLNIRKATMLLFGGAMVFYAIFVLAYASATYEFGIGTILSTEVLGTPTGFIDTGNYPPPNAGDTIVRAGDLKIQKWSDLLEAPGKLKRRIEHDPFAGADWLRPGEPPVVAIKYQRPGDGTEHVAWAQLTRFPWQELVPSLIWLVLKGALFVIGTIVYWKRPEDESAKRFYILCVITLGAYIGGYNFTQIVTQPILSTIFTACAVMLPVASL